MPIKVVNRWDSFFSVWGLHHLNKLLCSSRWWTHPLPPTHILLPLRSNTEQYRQLGSQPKPRGCVGQRGGGKGGMTRDPAAACYVRSCEGVRRLSREGRRKGEKRVRERPVCVWEGRASLAGSPALSFTPNQALVWAWNAFVFQNIIIASSDSSRGNPSSLIRRREGRKKEGREEAKVGHRRRLGGGGRSAEGQTDFYLT